MRNIGLESSGVFLAEILGGHTGGSIGLSGGVGYGEKVPLPAGWVMVGARPPPKNGVF